MSLRADGGQGKTVAQPSTSREGGGMKGRVNKTNREQVARRRGQKLFNWKSEK
jgi:hypothetical protein